MIKKAEQILFHRHSFRGPLLVCLLLGLPWWLAFWPGTLQYDSCGQLLQYIGVGRMTGHHPYPVTLVMGILLDIGRWVFASDNMGIFLYTSLQFVAQSCVIAYVFCVYEHRNMPMWIRWVSLLFYTIFPLIPNWGISYGKDTGYYISFLLLTAVMTDICGSRQKTISRTQRFLWLIALMGIAVFRNDGRYIVIIAVISVFLYRREYWKLCTQGACLVLGFLILVEGIYMPLRGIPKGSVREVLSVPLMQTAIYIRDYREEITAQEAEILLTVFEVEELEQVADAYDRNISDNVKALFLEYPTREELLQYLKVWWKQFLRQPYSYLQTYFEHCSGYFVLGEGCYDDVIGWFKILDGQSRRDEYLDIYFVPQNSSLRQILEGITFEIYELPVIGWLFRPAFYTWGLIGAIFCILHQKRWLEIFLFLPAFVVICVCTISPLNASVRYFLPVMVTLPLFIGLCAEKQSKVGENETAKG